MCCVMGFLSDLYSAEQIRPYFDRTKSRGPDDTRIEKAGKGLLLFHILAIMGLDESGMQPFSRGKDKVVSAMERSTAGVRLSRNWKQRATLSPANPTANCSCRCLRNTGWKCSGIWMRNSP